ncbi:hypothetical protein BpHYR1_001766 [Brachionus plicatilis]|uniref:Uncharacterized protein n=1 Tax=Brachionus plicatilis TaxID=10195 RepID=A0A3M7RHA7_BRAPC|nr:hypothetical protein BpHYR1_001766 [Brachionus plicatilis]
MIVESSKKIEFSKARRGNKLKEFSKIKVIIFFLLRNNQNKVKEAKIKLKYSTIPVGKGIVEEQNAYKYDFLV